MGVRAGELVPNWFASPAKLHTVTAENEAFCLAPAPAALVGRGDACVLSRCPSEHACGHVDAVKTQNESMWPTLGTSQVLSELLEFKQLSETSNFEACLGSGLTNC